MASTEYINVSGKVKWFKHITPNKFGKWSHDMWVDNKSLEKLRELQAEGVKNVIKKDDEGYYITFSRPTEIKVRGDIRGMAPPIVNSADGTPFPAENVGNGSDVTSTLEVYQHRVPNTDKKAKAIRWYASRVDTLVPFSRKDLMPAEEAANKVLDQQPPPTY